jgi:tRNA threonylcarbamoyl adenosine modification protein YeaZ
LTPSTVSTSLGLAIHTASAELGLALGQVNGANRYQVWDLGRSLSTHLHFHLNEFIQPYAWADLAYLAVAQGPGGFTGTRMGVVAARTLAQQLQIPLYAISTLAAIAWSAYFHPLPHHWVWEGQTPAALLNGVHLAVQLPAQRGEYYVAIYSLVPQLPEPEAKTSTQAIEATAMTLTVELSDRVLPAEQWQQTLAQWHHSYCLIQASGGLGKSVVAVLELAQKQWQQGIHPSWETALPFYGQSPV